MAPRPHGDAHSDREDRAARTALGTVPLAAAVWIVVFAWRPANFWALMTAGVGGLGALALVIRGPFPLREGLRREDLGVGIGASLVLYAVFVVGRIVAGHVSPFASSEIAAVNAIRTQAPAWAIVAALVAVIGPGEEVFWRGFVQWGLVRYLGPGWGWMGATALYGLVHVAAGNAMLVIAALVAGAFWGWMYLRLGRIAPVAVSHVLWDVAVLLVFPFR